MFFYGKTVLFNGVTSHYVIDQSMISLIDMKKIFGDEAKPLDST